MERKESQIKASLIMEPFLGTKFESEEAAKSFYNNYAKGMGFVMRVDAFRRSMRDVTKKDSIKLKPGTTCENRKPRAITREGCKVLIIVKREKSRKCIVTNLSKEHNHPPLLPRVPNNRSCQLSQTLGHKDAKIRELSVSLSRERKRCAALGQQLDMALKNIPIINNVIQNVREIEFNTFTKPFN